MPVHVQKANHYYGDKFLRSRSFKTSCNDLSLRKTAWKFTEICSCREMF